MENQLHIKFLEILAKNQLGRRFDISPFIVENYKKPDFIIFNEWYLSHLAVSNFLNDLKFRGFIDIEEDSTVTFFFDQKEEHIPVKKWYDEVEMWGFITSTGLDYLENYRLIQSNKSVNDASLRNYKSQRRFARVTIVVATLAAIFSFFDLIKPEPKMVELNKNIQVLSKETRGIKSQMLNLQNHLTFPPDSFRKH